MNKNFNSPNSKASIRGPEAGRNDAVRKNIWPKSSEQMPYCKQPLSLEVSLLSTVHGLSRSSGPILGLLALLCHTKPTSTVLLQCKKLLVLGKCKKTYGVISPLEFVHEGVSFINMHERRDATECMLSIWLWLRPSLTTYFS